MENAHESCGYPIDPFVSGFPIQSFNLHVGSPGLVAIDNLSRLKAGCM
jgi:hypothetical protein